MDRALKERIIGAVVLVIIAVLVVPVFLDGPSPDAEMTSEQVTLPGQNGQQAARKTVVLERDRDQPLPVVAPHKDSGRPEAAPGEQRDKPAATEAPAVAAGVEKEPAVAATTPKPKPEPETTPVREEKSRREEESRRDQEAQRETAPAAPDRTESATGLWAVQLGSFSNKANADRLAASLRESGYAAFLSQLRTSSGELHRVRIGPQKDRDSAEAVALKLSGVGMKSQVVPHP